MSQIGTMQIINVIDSQNPGAIAAKWKHFRSQGGSSGDCDTKTLSWVCDNFNVTVPMSGFRKWRKENIGIVRTHNAKDDGRNSIEPHAPATLRQNSEQGSLKRIEQKLDAMAMRLDRIEAVLRDWSE